jgi:Lsr2
VGVIDQVAGATAKLTSATRAAAGAVGGTVIGATSGAVRGAADGASTGMRAGSRSRPAAAVTTAVTAVGLGVAGIVDWPLLVGGAAVLAIADQLSSRRRSGGSAAATEPGTQHLSADVRPASPTVPGPARTDPAQQAAVREWAAEHGHQLRARGRIPQAVWDAYEAAH